METTNKEKNRASEQLVNILKYAFNEGDISADEMKSFFDNAVKDALEKVQKEKEEKQKKAEERKRKLEAEAKAKALKESNLKGARTSLIISLIAYMMALGLIPEDEELPKEGIDTIADYLKKNEDYLLKKPWFPFDFAIGCDNVDNIIKDFLRTL